MVWGCYYLTNIAPDNVEHVRVFSDPQEAILAYSLNNIIIQQRIKVRPDAGLRAKLDAAGISDHLFETSVGSYHLQRNFAC